MTAPDFQDRLYEIVEAAVVRPGDTLVISFAHSMSMDQFARAREYAKSVVGDDLKILFLGGALGLHVLRRDEATDGRGGLASFTSADGATDEGSVVPADPGVAQTRPASVPQGGAA